MKRVIFCLLLCLLLLVPLSALANGSPRTISGSGSSLASDSTNSACSDPDAIDSAVRDAEARADSDALRQCGAEPRRLNEYALTSECRFWDAVAYVRAQASYECEGDPGP